LGDPTHCLARALSSQSKPAFPKTMSSALFHLETPDGGILPVSGQRCLIGRSPDCDIRLSSPEVSRRHALILWNENDVWLMDAGSSGGTWLNDERISKASKLESGDLIGVGLTSLRFRPASTSIGVARPGGLLAETTRPGDAEWLTTSDTAVLWVTLDGVIAGGSKEAISWMAAFFEGVADSLPASVAGWLEGGMLGRMPFESRVGDQRLRISVFAGGEDRLLLVLRRMEPAFNSASLRRIGLSRAESAIVPWLIRGKRNDEIAAILGSAPKTIEKQVAAILGRLGVETRTAAAWNIIERTGAHR